MSSRAQVLRRKAGNEQALFISPGSTVRQLYRPVKRMSPGRLNLWQTDGYYVGSMSSQERKQRRRLPLILPILLTACFPSQGLLDFPTTRAEVQGSVGSPQLKSLAAEAACLLGQHLPWGSPLRACPEQL